MECPEGGVGFAMGNWSTPEAGPKLDFRQQQGFFFSSNPWKNSLFDAIPQDLHGLIDFYYRAALVADRPCLKADYKLKSRFGEFKGARGIIVDTKDGTIYVADAGHNSIQVFDPQGGFLRSFLSAPPDIRKNGFPAAMAIDFNGDLIVVNSERHQVHILSTKGDSILKFGTQGKEPGFLSYPEGVAVDNAGNLVVADFANHRIQTFSPTGNFIRTFGEKGQDPGQLCGPAGVAINLKNDIIVSESENSRIQVFTEEGQPIRVFQGSFSPLLSPWGLCLDKNSNIFVANTGDSQISIFSLEGEHLRDMRVPGQPSAVALDRQGNLLVLDSEKNKVQLWEGRDTK